MSGSLHNKDICESFLRETAIIMLESEEVDKNFGNKEAWDYLSTHLCGENDRQSCCYFLQGESVLLARLGLFQIRVGQQGSRELLSLLHNNEPNAGDERTDNPGQKSFDLGIVPKM